MLNNVTAMIVLSFVIKVTNISVGVTKIRSSLFTGEECFAFSLQILSIKTSFFHRA